MAAPVVSHGRNGARDQRSAGKRPRRVVNQHDLGLLGGEGREPGAHRSLPRLASGDGRKQVQARGGLSNRACSSGWMTGCTAPTCGMLGRRSQSDHRITGSSAERQVLLGYARPRPAPSARQPR